MPELRIANPEGQLTEDALAIIISTMHFPLPEDKDKRVQLADHYRSLKLRSRLELDDPQEDHTHTLKASEIEQLFRARDLAELVPDTKLQFRDGFLAGHWLTFRIYASQNDPIHNSDGRWYDYAANFFGSRMPINGWVWPSEPGMLQTILRTFGPVAHLWAAATYDQHFRSNLVKRRTIDAAPKLSWAVIAGHNAQRLAGLAQSYLQQAIEAGLFDEPRSSRRLEDMWSIPAAVTASPVGVEHPDHMIDIDFEALKQGYVPRSKSDAGTRKERRKQASTVATLIQMPESGPPAQHVLTDGVANTLRRPGRPPRARMGG